MLKINKKRSILNFIYIIFLLLCIGLLIFIPEIAMHSFLQGIRIWATKVLPALLPFFILVKLLSLTNLSNTIGRKLSPLTQYLYGVGGVAGYIYFMSILSGYPVGAKLTADIYKNNIISKGQAHTISSFTSTSGPLFIIGSVAIGMFKSQKLGFFILISHYIGALINGLLYKNKENTTTKINNISTTNNSISEIMTNSIMSIMLVGGFIALFYMILSLFLHLNVFSPICNILIPIGIPPDLTISIISGIIEVTTGASLLSLSGINFKMQAIILTFLISFGGFSIHTQAYCFLKEFEMSYSKFFLQKITHAFFSTLISMLIVLFF